MIEENPPARKYRNKPNRMSDAEIMTKYYYEKNKPLKSGVAIRNYKYSITMFTESKVIETLYLEDDIYKLSLKRHT